MQHSATRTTIPTRRRYCPQWCVVDHALPDMDHHASQPVPTPMGDAWIQRNPGGQPYIFVDATPNDGALPLSDVAALQAGLSTLLAVAMGAAL